MCRQRVNWVWFSSDLTTLFLLIGVFGPFMFNVITDTLGFPSPVLLFAVCPVFFFFFF